MEYINADEFLKQDEKVQKVFLDWWKPSVGDLAFDRKYLNTNVNCLECNAKAEIVYKNKEVCCPLLTEGQLRQFIEDKTGGILDIEYYDKKGYEIYAINNLACIDSWGWLGHNLLQAYWKVAVEIAKENIN